MYARKRKLGELSDKDMMLDHIPISLRYLPYWIRATWREQKRTATGEAAGFEVRNIAKYLSPNLRRPIFVIGAPRSGTTFLGASLAVLPELVYFFEPVMTKAAVHHVFLKDWPEWKSALFYRSVYSWLMRISHKTDSVFCEKTPGNCFIVSFLYRTFPGARFIHIVRDGRDSALSLAKKGWYANEAKGKFLRDPDGYLFGPEKRFWVEVERIAEYESTSNLHRCIWLWRRYVEYALLGLNEVPSQQMYQLRYEDLLSDTDRCGTEILNHIGVKNPESRASFLLRLSSTARTDSIGAWRRNIQNDEKAVLWDEAAALLEHFGYDRQ